MTGKLDNARAARWPNGRTILEPKQCQHCRAIFYPKPWHKPSDWRAAIFCGVDCSAKSRAVPIIERFAQYGVRNVETGCLEWTAYTDPKGYGRTALVGTSEVLIHRISWLVHVGAIPDELHVLHQCDNPPCFEPAHLFLGTNDDNVRDKMAKGRQPSVAGALNPRAKLTPDQVLAIRSDRRQQDEIAAEYGVSQSTISSVVRGASWRLG